jgi:MYXO-CTERM domain-containing protein
MRFRVSGVVLVVAFAFGCSSSGAGDDARSLGIGIIGGDPDTTSHAVFAIQNDAGGLCTGSLIAPNLILTAQHCVAELADPEAPVECPDTEFSRVYPASAFLVTWDADLSNGAPQSTIHEVNLVVTPPGRSLCGNDIALLRLSDNVPPEQAVPIIPRVDSRPAVDELFDAIGYGIQNPNDNTGITAGTRMRVDDNLVGCVGAQQCSGTGATGTEWAAEAPICSGDSGGPALDSQGRVIGVVSRGDPDCTVGIYSAVDSWKTMIIDTAVDAADDGDYQPPGWTGVTAGTGGSGGMGGNGGTSGTGGSGMTGGTGSGGLSTAGSGGTGGSMTTGGASGAGGAVTGGTSGGGTGGSGNTGGSGASNATGGTSGSGGTGGTVPVDSGTPPPDAGGGGLGSPCTSTCDPGYLCWSSTAEPPGICVPPCASEADCPNDYTCTESVGVCTPRPESSDDDDDGVGTSASCGCRTAPHAPGAPLATFATLLGLVTLQVRRRRSAKSA